MGEEGNGRGYESLWKAQEKEELHMTFDEVCVRARAFEKKSVGEYWVALVMLGVVIVVDSIYLVRFSEPLIRLGNASCLAVFLYIAVKFIRKGPPHRLRARAQPDSCVSFLRGELKKKREGLLELRWILCLLMPGLFALWWGGGPVAFLKWLGIDRPWLTQYYESPAPLIGFVVLLAVAWFGSGREARRIQREIEELGGEQPGK